MFFLVFMVSVIVAMCWVAKNSGDSIEQKNEYSIEQYKKKENVNIQRIDYWEVKYKKLKKEGDKRVEHLSKVIAEMELSAIESNDYESNDFFENIGMSQIIIDDKNKEIEELLEINQSLIWDKDSLVRELSHYQAIELMDISILFDTIKIDILSQIEQLKIDDEHINNKLKIINCNLDVINRKKCERDSNYLENKLYTKNIKSTDYTDCKNSYLKKFTDNADLIIDMIYDIYIYDFIRENKKQLYLDFKRGCITNEYGIIDNKKWVKSLSNIIKNIIRVKVKLKSNEYRQIFKKHHITFWDVRTENILIKFEGMIDRFNINHIISSDLDSITNGIEYENGLAEIINNSNVKWKANVTNSTNDQGVDVLVEYEKNIKVVIQCKRYNKPVGNKAVQEVIAGLIYYDADHAFVVTNNTFTNSAKQLAKSGNVKLLHHSEVMEELIKISDLSPVSV